MVHPFWKMVWQFFKMLNIESPYGPAIPHLGTQPREIKTCVHTKTCNNCLKQHIHNSQKSRHKLMSILLVRLHTAIKLLPETG